MFPFSSRFRGIYMSNTFDDILGNESVNIVYVCDCVTL